MNKRFNELGHEFQNVLTNGSKGLIVDFMIILNCVSSYLGERHFCYDGKHDLFSFGRVGILFVFI